MLYSESIIEMCDFVGVGLGLCPSQQFSDRAGSFSWVEQVLSNEDEVFCSRV